MEEDRKPEDEGKAKNDPPKSEDSSGSSEDSNKLLSPSQPHAPKPSGSSKKSGFTRKVVSKFRKSRESKTKSELGSFDRQKSIRKSFLGRFKLKRKDAASCSKNGKDTGSNNPSDLPTTKDNISPSHESSPSKRSLKRGLPSLIDNTDASPRKRQQIQPSVHDHPIGEDSRSEKKESCQLLESSQRGQKVPSQSDEQYRRDLHHLSNVVLQDLMERGESSSESQCSSHQQPLAGFQMTEDYQKTLEFGEAFFEHFFAMLRNIGEVHKAQETRDADVVLEEKSVPQEETPVSGKPSDLMDWSEKKNGTVPKAVDADQISEQDENPPQSEAHEKSGQTLRPFQFGKATLSRSTKNRIITVKEVTQSFKNLLKLNKNNMGEDELLLAEKNKSEPNKSQKSGKCEETLPKKELHNILDDQRPADLVEDSEMSSLSMPSPIDQLPSEPVIGTDKPVTDEVLLAFLRRLAKVEAASEHRSVRSRDDVRIQPARPQVGPNVSVASTPQQETLTKGEGSIAHDPFNLMEASENDGDTGLVTSASTPGANVGDQQKKEETTEDEENPP